MYAKWKFYHVAIELDGKQVRALDYTSSTLTNQKFSGTCKPIKESEIVRFLAI